MLLSTGHTWWVHRKTENHYDVLVADALLERDLTPMVVYQSRLDKRIWVRPREEFLERFHPFALPVDDSEEDGA